MGEAEVNGANVFDLKTLRIALQSSSTARRISQLTALNEQLCDHDLASKPLNEILGSLFNTYAFYTDRQSRFAVTECLETIFSNSPPVEPLAPFIDILTAECRKTGIAPSNALILVDWTSLLVRCLRTSPDLWKKWGIPLLVANGAALDLCLGSDTRPAIKHSAIVATRKGLRAVLLHESEGEETLKTLVHVLTKAGPNLSANNAVFLGVVAGVCATNAELLDKFVVLKKSIYEFYVNRILGSRTIVQAHVANGLREFFAAFTTESDFETEIVPSLEKSLLRSPEIVLNDLIRPLIQSLPAKIDLSKILHQRLLKPLISNIKSTNPVIRSGVLSTFEAALLRSQNPQIVENIATEILSPLKTSKISSADQRMIYAQMLAAIPSSASLSTKIPEGLSSTLAKESNEGVYGAFISTISKNTMFALNNGVDLSKSAISLFSNGLAEKRVPFRRLWAIESGDIVLCLEAEYAHNKQVKEFTKLVFTKLLSSWSEVLANPIAAVQSGLITVAYILAATFTNNTERFKDEALQSSISKSKILHDAIDCSSKTSFLLNPKIYSKITSTEDCSWAVRALVSCSKAIITNESLTSQDCWGQAFLYLISSPSVTPEINRQAISSLSKVYVESPAVVSAIVVRSLYIWQRHNEFNEKDSASVLSKVGTTRLHCVVRAICLTPAEIKALDSRIDKAVLEDQLASMVVICNPNLLQRVAWISTCLKCNIDPGDLAKNRSSQLKRLINESLSNDPSESQSAAIASATVELAFVQPDIFTPFLVDNVRNFLDPSLLADIGPTEAAIYRTPQGTTFVDVLDNKGGRGLDKNTKDYETLKWEEEIRAQLLAKKGQQRKLTADEQAKVRTQLAKEENIRNAVAEVAFKLRYGVRLVRTAVSGPPTDAAMWIGTAVDRLLSVIEAGAGIVIGDYAADIYLECSFCVASRLGPMREFIGVATLRATGISQLATEHEQEPLAHLITRVLYRLRFAGEQRPFDMVSLSYIMPLIFVILRKGGVGRKSLEDRDEQIILALEFISFHAHAYDDVRLPRAQILDILITCMQRFNQHHKVIKDSLLDLCRCIAPNITDEEIDVIIKGTIVPEISVRMTVLQCIDSELDLSDLGFCEQIWLAYHDDIEENQELASTIWEESALKLSADSGLKLLKYLESKDRQLRNAAARAIAESIKNYKDTLPDIILRLQELYIDKAKERKPQYDEYGMLKRVDLSDPWESRSGVALTFKELSQVFKPSLLTPFIQFLIDQGPLKDRNPTVRDEMVDAAVTMIAAHAKSKVEQLMQIFEKTLDAPDRASEEEDRIHEAVVIMYGSLGGHLSVGDTRVPKVVHRLLATLSTPSETVQYAVANCLPPLIRASTDKVSDYVQQVLDEMLQSKKFATRRGAAYGLAGIVHGKGIQALKEYRIIATLKGAVENKKDSGQRQGALFAYELLSLILGRVFEPYVIQIVPQLLSAFGDANSDVRDACLDAAKTCFATLSSYGVKQILPTLLEGLDDQQWRSKKGACDLLGAMAYLDPQQLASSLPVIIPPLTNVLNDSHREVRTSANRSLQRFGEVISNPEIKSVVNILLKALSDPTKHTDEALEALIKVSFIHYLDAPSLALVVRILQRGLSDRTATKRKSAQIIGSLAHLTERKDLISHLSILVAGLKLAIVDPVPTTRATASKALGSLMEKLGEEALPDLIPGLMATLKSDTGAGDRLGSAQALSEVLAGLGTGRLEETLPTILQNASSSKPSVREGFMSLFIFLPACFGNSFSSYLNRIIPSILSGLADDIESIRETSLRAGRLLVKNFATKAIDLLLPELERGLANDSHRIRLSSVELVGDLLFNLTGISAKEGQDDEMEDVAVEAGHSLLEVLGEDKRNKVLSSLYICRCDTSGLVRNAAISVWKALVASPRTLKELIPTLTQLIIRRLASSNMEQKLIAGNALGELIRKAGDGVLSTLLPTLENGLLTSTDADARQGICIALRELISSAAQETLEEYEQTLTSVVRTALVDPDEIVREAAAEAFDSLQRILGKRAVDQVLPHLLNLLRSKEDASNALAALLTLLTDNNRSNMILPNLIPTLIASPISSFNARAIASLASVAGQSMTRRLANILNALVDDIVSSKDEALIQELKDSFLAVLLGVDEFDGLNNSIAVMISLVKNDDHRKRAAACSFLASFFKSTEIDFSRYNQDLIRVLLISFDDSDPEVVKAALAALTALTGSLRKEEMESLVHSTRQILLQVGVAGSNLAGFALPNGIKAILPIFLQGLMNGTAEQRTQAALAISDIAERASVDSLKPFVIQMTGPLIRVVSERSTDLKVAVLFTLNNLLEKIPASLKPFLPQLQRTFAKSLADTSSEELRSRAAKALGTLIGLTPKIDPLVSELVTGSKFPDPGVQNAMNKALYEVISRAGAHMNEASREAVLTLVQRETQDEAMIITNARLLGALMKTLPAEKASALIKTRAVTINYTLSTALCLNAILVEAPSLLAVPPFSEVCPSVIAQGITSRTEKIAENLILASGKYLLSLETAKTFDNTKPIFKALSTALAPGSAIDSRRLALVVLRTVCRLSPDLVKAHTSLLAPPVFAGVRDPIIPIKLAAEAAFLELFGVVDHGNGPFEKYITGPAGAEMPANAKRSMQDYFKRVAMRLAAQARERRDAEGGQGSLGLSADEKDDEREVWSVGKVDLGDKAFQD